MPNPRGIKAGRAYVELGVNDQLTRGLRQAQRRLQAFGAGIRAIGQHLVVAGGAGVTAFAGITSTFASVGDRLDKMSKRTGVAVESLSELRFAAEQSGASLDDMEHALLKMNRRFGRVTAGAGSAAQEDAVRALGLSLEALRGMDAEQRFLAFADAMAAMADQAEAAGLAQRIFGLQIDRLLPLMFEGAAGIDALRDQARRLGLTIGTEAATQAAILTDQINALRSVLRVVTVTIGEALAPAVTRITTHIEHAAVAVSAWVKENQALFRMIAFGAAAVVALGTTLLAASLGITALAWGLGGLATLFTSAVAAVAALQAGVVALAGAMATQTGVAVGAMAALGAGIVHGSGAGAAALHWLQERFAELGRFVSRVVQGMRDALAGGDLGLAAEVAWRGMAVAWEAGVAELLNLWHQLRFAVVSVALDMWSGVRAAAEHVWHALEVGWIETVSALTRIWTAFTSDLAHAWNAIHAWLRNRWTDLLRLIGQLTDAQAEAARAVVDEQFVARARAIEARRAGGSEAAEQRRTERRAAARTTHQQIIDELVRANRAAQAALEAGTTDRLTEATAALEAAKAELADSLRAAEAARERRAVAGPERLKPMIDLEGIQAALGDAMRRSASTTGTFNPAALWGLAGGTEDRIAQATEETAKNTKRIARDRMVFT